MATIMKHDGKTDLTARPLEPFILNDYSCGCCVVSELEHGLGGKYIWRCPVHRAAPDLLAALEELPLPERDVRMQVWLSKEWVGRVRAAIKKARPELP